MDLNKALEVLQTVADKPDNETPKWFKELVIVLLDTRNEVAVVKESIATLKGSLMDLKEDEYEEENEEEV